MKTLYLFKNSKKSLKLVKNDNFFSILLNRRVVCSLDKYEDIIKIFELFVSKFISYGDLFLSYEVNCLLTSDFSFSEHRNSNLVKISRSF